MIYIGGIFMYKYQNYMHYFDKWMENREHDLWIPDYLEKQGEPSVAVYGCGMLGKHVIWELSQKQYPISWVMDKAGSNSKNYTTVEIKDIRDVEKVDLIIVTAMADYEEIEMLLCSYNIGRPIGLDELINVIHGGVK